MKGRIWGKDAEGDEGNPEIREGEEEGNDVRRREKRRENLKVEKEKERKIQISTLTHFRGAEAKMIKKLSGVIRCINNYEFRIT
jgi:hypothetical protein